MKIIDSIATFQMIRVSTLNNIFINERIYSLYTERLSSLSIAHSLGLCIILEKDLPRMLLYVEEQARIPLCVLGSWIINTAAEILSIYIVWVKNLAATTYTFHSSYS